MFRFLPLVSLSGNLLSLIIVYAFVSKTPLTLTQMPPVSIIWKQRKYNLDCREVASLTQSDFSCLCYYDIAKVVSLSSMLSPQVFNEVDV